MRMTIYIFFTLFTSVAFAGGEEAAAASDIKLVKQVMGRYHEAAAVKSDVKKEVYFALLDEKKATQGTLLFSKGRMRLEMAKPEEFLVVVNKEVIWAVTPANAELGSAMQVLKIVSKDLSQQSRAPMAMLFGQKKAWDQFKVMKSEEKNGVKTIALAPKKPDSINDVSSVQLAINLKENLLSELSYKDDLDNETKFIFSKTNFKAKVNKKSFSYSPPKSAEVTVYK